jgi:hypothetical protein
MGIYRQAQRLRWVAAGAMTAPRAARHVPRLLATYGKSPFDLRQPWLPFDLADQLKTMVSRSSAVFEYGGGGSTAWFADHAGSVVTVEHEDEWYAKLASEFAGNPRVTLIHRGSDDDYHDYVHAIDAYPSDSFDVVVVDGRARVRCVERAATAVKPGGLLLLDDVDRSRYAPAFDLIDWPRRIVRDFAPCKSSLAHTAVFTRPLS